MSERIIRNRDIPVLCRVLATMQEIKSLEFRRDWNRARMERVTQSLSGMPHAGGPPRGMEEAFAILDEIERQHAEMLKRYAEELQEAEKIVNGIGPVTMRAFVRLVYLMGTKRQTVEDELNMSEWEYRKARERIEGAESMERVEWCEQ